LPSQSVLTKWYAVIAVIALFAMALTNNSRLMLAISALGVVGGLALVARGPLTRAGIFGFVGFVVAGALAIFKLLR
jgi:hypothetical protein